MLVDSVGAVWEAVRRYEGVPRWWAEVFVNVGFTAADAVAWVETASRDPDSPLCMARERELNVTLRGYAAARGISLIGAGSGESIGSEKGDRLVHWVSTVTTPEEQEVIVREVDAYAEVRFKEKLNGVYTSHGVANAVRAVHGSYQRKVLTADMLVLEAGASVKSAVLSGVDPTRYHCCCPVLDVRDSVRHSLRGWLEMVAAEGSKFRHASRVAAKAALDPNSGFVCRRKSQDCTRQVDVVCSNESTHDIAFHDLPKVMARHGARLWVGFATRAPGVMRSGGPTSGKCRVFGTRWTLDREADKITFHFTSGGAFSYSHKFSEWVSYEEQFGYRWCGKYFDYVYTRMPITTSAALAFVVARVPKAVSLLREPVYKSSHLAGQVEIKSIKAVGGCVGVARPEFEPCVFTMESIVFDRALEMRLAQADRGGLASTIAYLRSARVRLAINGVALGVESYVPVDLLEPAAVAIEALACDDRYSGERDYSAIVSAAAGDAVVSRIYSYFSGLSRYVAKGAKWFSDALRQALLRALEGSSPVVVSAVQCVPYVKVSNGSASGVVDDVPKFEARGCGCGDLTSVNAALKMGSVLTQRERRELTEYARVLRLSASECVCHSSTLLSVEEADDEFFDASDGLDTGVDVSTTGASSSEASGSGACSSVSEESCVGTAHSSNSSVECVDSSSACDGLTLIDGSVSGESMQCEGAVVKAIREYSLWAQKRDRAARSEARLWADVLFQQGNPTLADIERSTTAKTRHAVVAVVNGKVEKVVGTLRDEETFSELYVRSLGRTCVVHTDMSGKRYVRERVTELCYTSTELLVVNGDELCRAALRLLVDLPRGFEFPRYKFVDGVPGCGKTYEIIEKIKASVTRGVVVLYLTATKASCEHVLREVARGLGRGDGFVVRTYDSYLMHGAVPPKGGSFQELYMDEAPMAHKGELFACMLKASAGSVELYGDSQQIPWCSFLADFWEAHAVIHDEFEVVRRDVTHRFGVRTCAMWLDVYESIYPCDCHEHDDRELQVVRIRSGGEVPALPGGKVLTFTQEEKVTVKRELGFTEALSKLKSMDAGGLSTVTEDQGGSHDAVSVVRLVNKKNPKESARSPSIYNRQPWVLVGTTRHKGQFKYYTTADDDLVIARLELSTCAVRQDAVRKKKKWKDVCRNAMLVRKFGI